MALNRDDLKKLLEKEDHEAVINYVMAENGKSINELKAKNQELESQILDKTKEFNDYKESTKDFETLKVNNAELSEKVNAYEAEKANAKYFNVLKEVGFNGEFVDEHIFSKLEKTEDMEKFKENAKAFLKEKPMYGTLSTDPVDGTHHTGEVPPMNNFEERLNNAKSDAEIQQILADRLNKK